MVADHRNGILSDHGELWAVASGFGWAAGSVATKYYQRRYNLDRLDFLSWQLLVGVLPLTPLPWLLGIAPAQWSIVYAALLGWTAIVCIAIGFLLWIDVLRVLSAGTASLNMFAIPVIALVSSMLVFDERRERVGGDRVHRGGPGDSDRAGDHRFAGKRDSPQVTPTPLDGG